VKRPDGASPACTECGRGRAAGRLVAFLLFQGGFVVEEGRRRPRNVAAPASRRSCRAALPWLRVDGRRIYAVGGSMGGQETLLLLGQHPKLLAGAVAFDSVTNFYRRYSDFARSPGGRRAQALAREEVGGTPRTNPRGYVLRSPTHWLSAVARSGVPLQLWWSDTDQIVIDQAHQSGVFYRELRKPPVKPPPIPG
jgi:pimeloyl-ACP methyl ester carboxylesterase